ncbi:MAG: amidohydrolase family protein [Novosphingobium sp.]|nr:amidohydrolase family protein [Novosphingobium sp.]MCP5401201.1 amidohydrolase family protein [Novosphingobium sp.]
MNAVPLLERTLDVDGHEFAPPHLWGGIFGPVAERLADVCAPFIQAMGDDYINRPGQAADDSPMTAENVWTLRHTGAPGAFDMERRLEAMDLMGVQRQLIFPSYGLWGQILSTPEGGGPIAAGMRRFLGDLSVAESVELGFAATDEWNDWAVRTTALDPDRLRPVGMLKAPRDADDLLAQASDLIGRGLKGLLINSGSPPAGLSPATQELDPFWALLAESNVPVMAHVGSDLGFLNSPAWSEADAFAPNKLSFELGFEPYSLATTHLAVEHFLTVMVLGGVFERHPALRFGAIELGAHWLGPLADNLDMWAEKVFARRIADTLTMKPSDYLARNVRVTPHNIVEPVDRFFERYPQLSSCYCYSTDYPHLEGGAHIATRMHDLLEPLGDAVLERYFVANGEWLLP